MILPSLVTCAWKGPLSIVRTVAQSIDFINVPVTTYSARFANSALLARWLVVLPVAFGLVDQARASSFPAR